MNTARFREILKHIRGAKPDIAITTDIICGFPGETEEIFDHSLEFLRDCQFSGGHVFPFSALQGTTAFTMEAQVPHSIRRERTTTVRQVLDEAERAFISRRLGKTAKVLFEGKAKFQGEWIWQGWSEDFLKVFAPSEEDLHNQILIVQMDELTTSGEIIAHAIN